MLRQFANSVPRSQVMVFTISGEKADSTASIHGIAASERCLINTSESSNCELLLTVPGAYVCRYVIIYIILCRRVDIWKNVALVVELASVHTVTEREELVLIHTPLASTLLETVVENLFVMYAMEQVNALIAMEQKQSKYPTSAVGAIFPVYCRGSSQFVTCTHLAPTRFESRGCITS